MDKLKKKGARSLGGAKKKEYFCNYLGLLPFFILFGVFMLYPFLYLSLIHILRAYAADERLARVDTVIIIGHGTSLATAMNAEFLFSRAAGAAARAVPAYQFRSYARDYLKRPERTLVVGISCSGNTESVVKGLEAARQAGALAMGTVSYTHLDVYKRQELIDKAGNVILDGDDPVHFSVEGGGSFLAAGRCV